jgi:hypothetical protein
MHITQQIFVKLLAHNTILDMMFNELVCNNVQVAFINKTVRKLVSQVVLINKIPMLTTQMDIVQQFARLVFLVTALPEHV